LNFNLKGYQQGYHLLISLVTGVCSAGAIINKRISGEKISFGLYPNSSGSGIGVKYSKI